MVLYFLSLEKIMLFLTLILFDQIIEKMSHTYSKIWLHYIWATRNRLPLIKKFLIPLLIDHYKTKYPKGGDIFVDTVNGVSNHFHLLIGQSQKLSASDAANQLKGESSHWINSNDFIPEKFAWQNGFKVFSVSHSQVQRLRSYIMNQEEHHRKITYEEEYRDFLKAHDIDFEKQDDERDNEDENKNEQQSSEQ